MVQDWRRRLPPLAILILLISIAAQVLAFWPLRIDDAYIQFRFARNLREGLGLVWNAGEPPVEGMTSPLWTVLLAPFSAGGGELYTVAKILGLAAILLAFALALMTALSLSGRPSAAVLAGFLAVSPAGVFHALNGLETGLACFWVSAMVLAAVNSSDAAALPGKRGVVWSVLFALAWLLGGLTRPELVLYGAFLAIFALPLLESRRRLRWLGTVVPLFAAPALIYFLWRWRYFGHLFPLTYYAKRPEGIVSSMGLGYVALSFLGLTGGAAALTFAAHASAQRGGRDRRLFRFLAVPPLFLSATYLLVVPTMGFVYRFITPFLLPLLVSMALATLSSPGRRRSGRARLASGVLIPVTLVQLASSALPAVHYARINSSALRRCHEAIGRVLAQLPEKGRLLTLSEAGAMSYVSGWPSAEGVGLVTPSVLFEGLGGAGLVRRENPDVIVLSCLGGGGPAFQGYRTVRAVPWLVFEGGERDLYQCVYARDGYRWAARLTEDIDRISVPVIRTPRYLWIYEWLRRVFRQSSMKVAAFSAGRYPAQIGADPGHVAARGILEGG